MTTLIKMEKFNFTEFEGKENNNEKEEMMIDYVLRKGSSEDNNTSNVKPPPDLDWGQFTEIIVSQSIKRDKKTTCGWSWNSWKDWAKWLSKNGYAKMEGESIDKDNLINDLEEGEKRELDNNSYILTFIRENYDGCSSVKEFVRKGCNDKGKQKLFYFLEMKIKDKHENKRKNPKNIIQDIISKYLNEVCKCRQCFNRVNNIFTKVKELRCYRFECSNCHSDYML